MNRKNIDLDINGIKTLQLKATIVGASKNIVWSSSNKSIAIVSSTGKVTARKAGTCIITAKANNCKATCLVRVNMTEVLTVDAEYFNKMPVPLVKIMGNGQELVQINMTIEHLDEFIKRYGRSVALILSDGNIALKMEYEILEGTGKFGNAMYVLVKSSYGKFIWCGTGYYKGKVTVQNSNTLVWEMSLPKNSFNMNDIKYVSIEARTANSRMNTFTYKYDVNRSIVSYWNNQNITALGCAVSSKGYQKYLE